MGYQTCFRLNTIPNVTDELIDSMNQYFGAHFYDDDLLWGDSCSWYAHERDMLDFSKQHPYFVFVLDGNGEDAGDLWRKFFRDGKMYEWRPMIERPAFDQKLLKAPRRIW